MLRVSREKPARLEFKDYRVKQVILELKVKQVILELRATQVILELRAKQVLRVSREKLGSLEFRGQLVLQVNRV